MRVTGLVVTLALCSTLAACAGEASEPAAAASSTLAATEAAAAETPLEGAWQLRPTKQDVVNGLQEGGFAKLVPRFLHDEGIWAKDWWEWTFTGDQYVTTWRNPDGTWRTADWGTFEVSDDRVELASGDSRHTCNFIWSIKGDSLRLVFVDCTHKTFQGLPEESYWRAYLSQPLTRVL